MTHDLPIACDLTAIKADERPHHEALTYRLFSAVQEVHELPDGYGFRLPLEMLLTTAEFVSRERLCCPFFRFRLEIEPAGAALWLHLAGNEEIKQFVQASLVNTLTTTKQGA